MGAGTAAIVWGAEKFAEHLADASKRLGVTAFALAILLAGAEPEELATVVTASARGVDGVAFGDVTSFGQRVDVRGRVRGRAPRLPFWDGGSFGPRAGWGV